jgi:hypothetical protein
MRIKKEIFEAKHLLFLTTRMKLFESAKNCILLGTEDLVISLFMEF